MGFIATARETRAIFRVYLLLESAIYIAIIIFVQNDDNDKPDTKSLH